MNQQSAASIQSRSRWPKIIGAAFAALFLFLVLLGMYWSPMPKLFWVNEYVDDQRTVVGFSTTDTLIRVAETMPESVARLLPE